MIREVKRSEIDVLCEVSRQTFSETFAAVNTPKDLQDYLDQNLTVEKLTAEFEQPHSYFYFLEKEGEIAGFLKLNLAEAQTEYQQDHRLPPHQEHRQTLDQLKIGVTTCLHHISV